MADVLKDTTLLGVGIYSLQEAERFSGVSVQKIRRWIRGYTYDSSGKRRFSKAVWVPQFDRLDGKDALGFLDLIELIVVDTFIQKGVSWNTMRKARVAATKRIGSEHPFCTGAFFTDGRGVFVQLEDISNDHGVIEIVEHQRYFDEIIRPLVAQLEFSDDRKLVSWSPLGFERQVVVDPARSFGAPIVRKEGVPTHSLYSALRAGNSADLVAQWYEVTPIAVADANEFEMKYAA